MEIVVDTNIIISALLKEGLTRKIILLAPFEMYTVPFARLEIEEHKAELLNKSGLDDESFQYLIDLIFARIRVVDPSIIEPFKKKAIEIMKSLDVNDSPFLALAMALNCPIWSNDGDLKKQNIVKVYTTQEILELLK